MIATEVKYKKTGVEWIPEIPNHWEVRRLKQFSKIETGTTPPKIDNSNYSEKGIPWIKPDNLNDFEPLIDSKEKISKDGLKGARLIPKDSVLVCCIGTIGKIGVAGIDLTTNQQINSVIFNQEIVLPRFGKYLIFSSEKEHWRISTKSVVSILNKSAQGSIKFPIPPLNEQKVIANYLDAQSVKITHFIQTKQRFIELLKEQRQSIISNAVTKGIDDGVKMKETVLGKIPEHWEVRRLGTIGRFSKGGNISRSELIYTDGGVPAILYGDLYTKYDIVAENIINRITKETAANSVELKKGDLLFTGSGETKEDIGKCVVFNSDEPAYAGGDVIIFKQDIFDSYFISYSQNSSIAKYQKAISSKGEIIVHTYGSKLRDVILPYPPTIEEQKQIVEHIKAETQNLDIAISKAEREIELIKEYREAMVSEAVMGKMKL